MIAAAFVAATGGAAVAVAEILPTPKLAVLDSDVVPELSDAQARLASSQTLRDIGFDVEAARAVKAPEASRASTWLVGRSANGVCVVTTNEATTCVPTATFNREGVLFLSHKPPATSRSQPIPTAKELKAARRAGGFASKDSASSSLVTVYGAVPDGVSAVALLNGAGKAGTEVPTPSSVYQLENVDLSAVSGLQLIRTDGANTVAPLGFSDRDS